MAQPLGIIIYRGPSMLDGKPIVAIVSSLGAKSSNVKTGHMVQTYILADGIEPHAALKSGDDASVCGDCKHRPANGGACYVRVDQGPLVVYRAYQRGRYVDYSADMFGMREACAGKLVRLGSYGDPAAVPFHIWQNLVSLASGVTGYTHQWRNHPEFAALCMASVDTFGEYMEARAQGWRTFRVRAPHDLADKLEVICPASKEAGFKTVCASCKACGGHSSKAKAGIVIMAHGAKASRFNSIATGE